MALLPLFSTTGTAYSIAAGPLYGTSNGKAKSLRVALYASWRASTSLHEQSLKTTKTEPSSPERRFLLIPFQRTISAIDGSTRQGKV
jgi:hypothetical protein